MSNISVSDTNPKSPKITLKTKPFQVNKTTTQVVTPGTGKAIGVKDIAYVSYTAVNGSNGKVLTNTFDKNAVAVNLTDTNQFPGLVTALKGQKVGAVLNVAIPPADGFGGQGSTDYGITSSDSLIFRIKVLDTAGVLDKATGATVAPKAGLPTVTVSDGNMAKKAATITMPKTGAKVATAPTKLVVQPLITGTGRKIVAGETVKVRYTGVIWASGKEFDSSSKHQGAPADFPLIPTSATNPQGMIPGFVTGLVGQQVGSRVLLVMPPAEGYGTAGNTQAGIKGTDTLVFVVDILAAL
ncbi:hypothetical protein GCM10027579_14710 [Calidifontibacter terrae]